MERNVMRTKLTFILTVVVGLSISQVAVLAQTPVGTEFTYQGLLKQSGAPVNDTADFVLHLYDADTGGNQVGSLEAVYNVPVVDGLFTVELDFGDGVFTGDARWLEIAVRSPAGSGAYTTLSPRQPLNATPYALYALNAPGGSSPWEITGSDVYYDAGNVGVGTSSPAYPLDVYSSGGTALHARNTSSTGGTALSAASDIGSAISASAFGSSGTTHGVSAEAHSPNGFAIYGINAAGTGNACALFGRSYSTSGRAIYGNASAASGLNYGVYGQSFSSSGRGVYGLGSATSGLNYGVYGKTDSPSGFAGFFMASTTSGINYGVYGQTNSPSGYAGYFAGGRNYFQGDVGIGTSSPAAKLHIVDPTPEETIALINCSGDDATGLRVDVTGVSSFGIIAAATDVAIQGNSPVEGGTFSASGPGGRGLAGIASAATGAGKGVYGRTNSPDGYAGYFQGRGYFSDKVGIGILNPTAKLHIAGTAGVDGVMFPDGTLQTTAAVGGGGDSLWSESGSDIFYTAGNVGVGTSSPGYRLHVVDSSSTAIYGECQGEGTRGELGSESGGVFGEGLLPGSVGVYGFSTASTGNGDGVRGETESGTGNGVFGENHSATGNAIGVRGATSSPTGFGGYFEGRGYFSGNVGIGTFDPAERLDVDGVVKTTGFQLSTGAATGRVLTSDASGTATWQVPSSSPWTVTGADVYYDAGNVGIGTYNPAENLHVVGDSFFDGNVSIGTGTQSRINLNSGHLLMNEADGTTTVDITAEDSGGGARLGLRQNSGAETIVLDADHYSDYVHWGARVELNQNNGTTGLVLRAKSSGGGLVQVNDSAGDRRVQVGAWDSTGGYLNMKGDNETEDVRLYGEDPLGVHEGGALYLRDGTIAGLELHANYSGTGFSRVVTDVIEITGGADLSEQFYVTEQAEQVKPGMVVVIDADHPGKLTLSDIACDRKVAGVVSGAGGVQPGMLMGQRGTTADGTHPIALTGRVWAWCEASSGAIQPGDLLTTSNVPGHAMKVTDYARAQGAVIGKAMTPLKEGKGLVLVLVNLQ